VRQQELNASNVASALDALADDDASGVASIVAATIATGIIFGFISDLIFVHGFQTFAVIIT